MHVHYQHSFIASQDAKYDLCGAIPTEKFSNSSSTIVKLLYHINNQNLLHHPCYKSQFVAQNPTFYPGMDFPAPTVPHAPFQPSYPWPREEQTIMKQLKKKDLILMINLL